jgi:hypothetical protein
MNFELPSSAFELEGSQLQTECLREEDDIGSHHKGYSYLEAPTCEAAIADSLPSDSGLGAIIT